MVTWGTTPGAVVPVTGVVPNPADEADEGKRAQLNRMLEYMALTPGQHMQDLPIDVVFIGSCTNGGSRTSVPPPPSRRGVTLRTACRRWWCRVPVW